MALIYIARRHYDYEGYDIIGVFDSEEKAQHCIDNDISFIESDGTKVLNGDKHSIQKWEVK